MGRGAQKASTLLNELQAAKNGEELEKQSSGKSTPVGYPMIMDSPKVSCK